MAEIRLVCPGCAAEYRVSDTAIPPQGREVECSACGHVWHAAAPSARLALTDALPSPSIPPAASTPPLNRPLPSSVLDILRDEVEHERRARAAQTAAPEKTGPEPRRSPADPEWPATTITRHIDPPPAPVHTEQPARQADPAPADPAPIGPAAEPASTAAIVRPPVRPTPAARPADPLQRSEAVASPRRGRYWAGVALALVLTAMGVVLYTLTPALTDQGALGDTLVQARAGVDGVRLWLQDRADLLLR